ncbi:MAG: NYN domain-containing protein [Gemmatimonadetes bacterium]|nr:NYN domain-containing protein [Gemmatimonadota bacterium]
MVNPYMKVPHADPGRPAPPEAPNAALLIDFDNVTMGMRSDLAKELKRLLDSDIIKGKVTVQRAYADWRRYPQYIVPLSEASIDLIFAPAYGSSKKNATDIRMAIDGMELVFIRPEIGTFILLTGDSDFSSLVLKLKEYGKYVVGIGIQESSSDILVQNCDEYYSYTSLTGLHKATDKDAGEPDAWQCVEEAVGKMVARGDVMRSDRLKQVMMELSPGFDERSLGFKSFSKFLVAAANKGIVEIQRGANGQYVIAPPDGSAESVPRGKRRPEAAGNGQTQRVKERRKTVGRGRAERSRSAPGGRSAEARNQGGGAPAAREPEPRRDPGPAVELLGRAVRELAGKDGASVRDSDVKRKMLAIDKAFDESDFGFSKFSKFLQFAESKGAVALGRAGSGSFEVRLARRAPETQPGAFDPKALGLPIAEPAIRSYLANRYKGVGVKTAERLVENFGADVFKVLQHTPERVGKALSRARAGAVLAEWEKDYKRRSKAVAKAAPQAGAAGGRGPSRSVTPGAQQDARGAGDRGGRGRGSRRADDARTGQSRLGLEDETGGSGAGHGDSAPDANEPEPVGASEGSGRTGLRGLLPWGRRKRDSGGAGR